MFVVFDIESTGLYESTCDVIEFAYIMFDDNNNFVKSEQLFFYYEGMSWSEEAYAVHQIPMDYLKQFKDQFKQNIIKMYTVLNHANVVGHNCIRFDCPFVRTWLMRQGLRNLEFGLIHDTMKDLKPISKRSRIKLTTLTELCGYSEEAVRGMVPIWFKDSTENRSHQAGYDVTATALIALKAIRDGIMSFKPILEPTYDQMSGSMNDMFESGAINTDPNRFIVQIKEGTDYDGVEYYCVNHDHSQFADTTIGPNDISNFEKMSLVFPIVLTRESHDSNVYLAERDGVVYKLVMDETNGDEFIIDNSFTVLRDTDLDMQNFIRNAFSKESDGEAKVKEAGIVV